MLLAKADACGDWFEDSSLGIVRVERMRHDARGYYRMLGIEADADDREVRRAARRKLMESHPDRGGDEGEFADVLEAYHVLSDPASRAAYDADDSAPCVTVVGKPFVPHMEGRDAPAWYKEPTDLLSEDDVRAVRAWHALVLEAARAFRQALKIKVGVCRCPAGYYRESDIALIGHGTKPERWAAMCFCLIHMCERK